MIKSLAQKLYSLSQPVAYGFGPGVKISGESLQKGGILTPRKKLSPQANSGSLFPNLLKGQKQIQEKEFMPRSPQQIDSTLRETNAQAILGNKFRVILIQEGLGNFTTCFYYTKSALQGAVSLFEGSKCYADHPSSVEEQIRPERSTRDILGYYENVVYEEAGDGRGLLTADLCLNEGESFDWARTLLTNSIKYATKYKESDFVGFSINADGKANPSPLEEFMKLSSIPESVIPKLLKAQQAGISEIQVVDTLVEATSVDLVTEAGAGGRVLQMIEQERKPMKQKHENDTQSTDSTAPVPAKNPKNPLPSQKTPPPADDTQEAQNQAFPPSQPAPHDDEEQDAALIKKMIKQYLGDDADEDNQETQEMAKHAYQAHREEGMEHEAAYEAAGQHLKMAMAIGKRMAQKQGEECRQTESENESESETHENLQQKESSSRSERIRDKAEIARLTEALKKYELRDYLERKCIESKRPVHVTKKFREALGHPKNKVHIDESFKLFFQAYDCKVEEATEASWSLTTEKIIGFQESSKSGSGSFADCLATF